ncbi:hypothetical protein NPIL_7551 [Nephila pilipes]|uniref:Uncharacterized protein n=1 Tax=Nephila pilipes TaxID=299642 RepID=A0A8X6TXV0_NEPPI|nr:hypothetical protein NPIL_7551 [Nephila pilipes]
MDNWVKIGSSKRKGVELTEASETTDSMTTSIIGNDEIYQQTKSSKILAVLCYRLGFQTLNEQKSLKHTVINLQDENLFGLIEKCSQRRDYSDEPH